MAGKQWTLALNEKSLVFLTVNLYEILHTSTYTIYNYIYKVKKTPRLVCGRQPPRAAAARFALARIRLRSHVDWRQKEALVMLSCELFYSALDKGSDQGYQNAYHSGLPSAAGFLLYIHNIR